MIFLYFEYKVILFIYGYLKMVNNVNIIVYFGGVFMYVYIFQVFVIKCCKRYKGIYYIDVIVIYIGILLIKR